LKRSVLSWLPSREQIERERERRMGRLLAAFLEEHGEPAWPAWPPEEDADYHRWVREHWTPEASDEFDLFLEREDALWKVERHELCFDLVDERDDAEAVRRRLLDLEMPVWPESYAGEWWQWYGRWPPLPLDSLTRQQSAFVQELWAAVRALSYRPDAYEQERTSDRRRFDQSWQRPQEELLAELRERRVCGIRGRYRLSGMAWEEQQGVTEADIDAP
jgi:hypothetical protein